MRYNVNDDEVSQWAEFWAVCSRLLTIYPERPATMSGDAEAKQLERQLKELGGELLPELCENEHWLVDASVGKGNWAAVPWVAFFDTRETTTAQKGVYPVIHLSSDDPVGIRVGLGIAAKAFRGREDEKAADVWEQLGGESRQQMTEAGFVDVISGTTSRTSIGSGSLAKRYAKGMVFERFVDLEELKRHPAELTGALKALLVGYTRWAEQESGRSGEDTSIDFLTLMREYADERIVFASSLRQSRFLVASVDDRGCRLQRLDAQADARVTASAYQSKLAWLKEYGGKVSRQDLDNTMAVVTCYLQLPELGLQADGRTVVLFEDDQQRADHFIALVQSIGSVKHYKPVILTLVIEAIRDEELLDNQIHFDWLLPRFIARMREHGEEIGEQQLAEGFGRLASDLFWLLAHHDTNALLDVSAPTAAKIRDRVSHARLQEAYWQMLKDPECNEQVLNAIKEKWWSGLDKKTQNLWLVPASDNASRRNADKTLERPFSVTQEIENLLPENHGDYVWGTKDGNLGDWKNMQNGDLCLFYTQSNTEPGKAFYFLGRIKEKLHSPDAGDAIWNDREFELLFFLDDVEPVKVTPARLSECLNEFADYGDRPPLGLRRIRVDVVEKLSEKYGDVWTWFNQVVLEKQNEIRMDIDVVEDVIEAIAARGFVFQPWQIATYITALRTKPFVILAGVSGTGKSKLPALISELTDGIVDRVSVRPDWTDSSDVLGYVDLRDRFRPGVVLKAANAASMDGDRFHVCLLDEMNLARVEHYFAEVLSSIEDRHKSADGGYETTKLVAQVLPDEFREWQEQIMPANFGIVGTVNMDESSHGFSRKVLDRAFTLELSEVDLDWTQSIPTSEFIEPIHLPASFWHCRATRLSECDQDSPQFRAAAERSIEVLKQANDCLVHSQLQVGYRTRDEVVLFLMNAEDIKDSFRTRSGERVDPLDLALMMKVLPRLVGGSNAIHRTMIGLLGLAHGQSMNESEDAETAVKSWADADRPDAIEGVAFPRTASRLCLMWERLKSEGYTSFWL
ncbi:MAG: DUF3578 domain-containing protein [Rubripirellula sp.]